MADDTLPHPAPRTDTPPPRTFDPAVKTSEPVKPGAFSGTGAKPAAPTDTRSTGEKRLRAFEDEHLGRRAVRIRGLVERGHGSPFREMSEEKQAEHAALVRLVEAEDRVTDAETALGTAKVNFEVAKRNADEAAKTADAAAVETKKAAAEDAAADKPVQQKTVAPSPGYAPAPAPRLDAFGNPIDAEHKVT